MQGIQKDVDFFLVIFGIVAITIKFIWNVFVNAFSILPILLIIAAIPPYRNDKFNALKVIIGIWFIYHYWS